MATPTAGAQPTEEAGINPHRWLILLGLNTAAVMEVLDTTIINVALPQMAGNLSADNALVAGFTAKGAALAQAQQGAMAMIMDS